MQAAAGTQVIYYLNRQDRQTNPDQVSGADAWSAHQASNGNVPVLNSLGTISYSGNYGRCSDNCVRIETLPGYTDPTQYLLKTTERRRPGVAAPGVYPVEVQRIAHQTITETRVEAVDDKAPALMASGGAMSFNIGQALNNDNSRIAAGGDLFINGAAGDGRNNALVRNSAITPTRTYTFANRSGYGNASFDNAPPVEWVDWINPPIEQKLDPIGGTITSNATLRIEARNIANNSVRAAQGPAGASPLAIGLDGGIAPFAGSAWNKQSLSATGAKTPVAPMPGVGKPLAIDAAAPREVDGARAGIVAAPLPANGLYRIVPEPARPYLVQTDPRVTSYANFLSSDWMLQRLGIDPGQAQKRLGDGFYEQRLVQNQVTGLTGKRFLAGYASAEEEYAALMTNGLAYAQRFGLEPGIALTDAQMEALTTNMVWLVAETVTLPDGSRQIVLAPQVYLARSAALTPTGALIAGNRVIIRTDELDNSRGTVRGEILNAIQADGAIDNDGGSLLGGDLAIRARSISNASLVGRHSATSADGTSTVEGISDLSRIEATGNMRLDIDGLFSTRGARIAAGGNGSIVAETVSLRGINLANSAADTHGDIDPNAFPAKPSNWDFLGRDTMNPAQGSHYASAGTQNFGSALSAGGSFSVFSNGSLDFLGSEASVGKNLTMAAAGPVTIGAEMGGISLEAKVRVPGFTYQESRQADAASGSALRAGGDVRVLAGAQRDADGTIRFDPKAGNPTAALGIVGSNIAAGLDANGQGAAMLGATGSLDIGEATLRGSYREESYRVIERKLTTSRVHELRDGSGDAGVGSTVAGASVSMLAGGDMRIAGSAVGASGDVQLTAGGNIDIAASRHRETRHELTNDNTSGIMVTRGGLLVGSREERDEGNAAGLFESRARSMVGSGTGAVGIAAMGDVNVRGAGLIAGDKVGIVGRNIAVAPGEDAIDSRQRHDVDESGLFITASGTVPTAVNAAGQVFDRKATGGDTRIASLQAAKAAMTMYNLSSATSAGGAASSGDAAGMGMGSMSTAGKASAMFGNAHSHTDNVGQIQTHSGSTVVARNGITLTATGSGAVDASGAPSDGDIRIAGSQVSGHDVSLLAARDIRLEAAADRYASRADAASSSFMAGVSYGASNGQYGLTLDASGTAGRGKGNTDSIVYRQTGVTASGTLSLLSGRDTSLLGAQASGETVHASVGRDLLITSTQDTEKVDIAQTNGALNVSVCLPYVCYGNSVNVSGSVNTSSISGDYVSVRQQSGIFAGQGGFDVAVKGKTELTGAVIGSTAMPEKNRFSTGTLVLNDQSNHAEYDSKNFDVSFSVGAGTTAKTDGDAGAANQPAATNQSGATDGGQGDKGGTRVLPNAGVPSGDSVYGTTKSAIAAGDIRITDDAGQQALTGKSAAQTVATLNRDVANANGMVERILDLQKIQRQQQLAQLIGEVGNQAIGLYSQKMGYADGSAEKIALHGALGYIQAQAGGGNGLAGMSAGAASEWIGSKVDEYLRSNTTLTENQRNTIQQWAALTAGGIVGGAAGGSAGVGAGAAVGLDADRYNRQLHPAIEPFISDLAKKQTRFSEAELQDAARVVLANDRIGDGTRRSYASEAEASTAGSDKVQLAPDGKYYEVVTASPEAVQYVTVQLRTGPVEIQNEFMAAQLDRIRFDAKPWYTEAQNAGIDMLVTSPAMGSNAPPATVGATKSVPAASTSSVVGGDASAQKVVEETAALGRIAANSNGPDLTERAPNSTLNRQAVRQLESGILPGKPIGKLGSPREMPASPDSSATAADFATRVLGRQLTQAEFEKGASMNRGDCEGCWIASSDNGKTFIVYRPAGKASPDTLPTTSTAEINNEASTNSINNGNVLKLKFPQLIDNP